MRTLPERAADSEGRIAPGRGVGRGRRVVLHRVVDGFAGARRLGAFAEDGGQGGYAKALASGSIEKELAESRAAREKAYSARRRALVGVNNFPDVTEKTPEGEVPAAETGSPLPQVRVAEPFEKIRRRTTEHAQATGRYPRCCCSNAAT